MPRYRSIKLELSSQHGIQTIPEYVAPEKPSPDASAPKLLSDVHENKVREEPSSTCEVYIPTYPSSQFWFNYSIAPPIPPDLSCFFFKLFLNGMYMVSWGCGPEEGWAGRTMFGLYERPEDEYGRKRVEKRALFFGGKDDKGKEVHWDDAAAFMEVRVYRAKGRKRVPRQLEEFGKSFHAGQRQGIENRLVDAGISKMFSPKRFYKFALIDPVDKPFATFKYHYRTMDQLRELGLQRVDNGSAAGARGEASKKKGSRKTLHGYEELGDTMAHDECDASGSSEYATLTPPSLRPLPPLPTKLPVAHQRAVKTPKHFRLSIPPSLKLSPSRPSFPKRAPRKVASSSSLSALREQPSVDEWIQSTPSPVKSIRNTISSPTPEARKRGNSIAALREVVSKALKRRGVQDSPEPDNSPLLTTTERC
ncbi:hypothetical protein BU16DRAFT_554749 [Lophium mytilinum]|uniref:Uncharacterized protein n=1 Tax=Lophium mytilinum TaxID=390894 RepID=A0A6A6RG78_9PEZI|nr:hypothetical protein BU16DRAFT_554749 [Lophium mytilinum]